MRELLKLVGLVLKEIRLINHVESEQVLFDIDDTKNRHAGNVVLAQ
jgi:hypothetical protein